MGNDKRNIVLPLAGIVAAAIIYTIVILLFVVEGEEIGSVAEWIAALGAITVGLVAAAFAGLAWRETQQATEATENAAHWAKIAAQAQEQSIALQQKAIEVQDAANQLAASGTTAEFTARVLIGHHEETWTPTHSTIIVRADEKSDPVWIQSVMIKWAGFEFYDTDTDRKSRYKRVKEKPLGSPRYKMELPFLLPPGKSLYWIDPTWEIHKGEISDIVNSRMTLTIRWSAQEEMKPRLKDIQVDLSDFQRLRGQPDELPN